MRHFEIPLLRRRKLIVENDKRRTLVLNEHRHLLDLAAPQKERRIGLRLLLDERADDGRARRACKLRQLGERILRRPQSAGHGRVDPSEHGAFLLIVRRLRTLPRKTLVDALDERRQANAVQMIGAHGAEKLHFERSVLFLLAREEAEAADALAREPPDGRHRIEAQAAKRRDVGIAELRIADRMRMDAAHARKAHLRAGIDGGQIDRPRVADGNFDDAPLAVDVDGDFAPDFLRDGDEPLVQLLRRKLPNGNRELVECSELFFDMRFEILRLALEFFALHSASFSVNSAAVIIFGCFIPDSKKSLSPVSIISAFAAAAARRIGRSFVSLIRRSSFTDSSGIGTISIP